MNSSSHGIVMTTQRTNMNPMIAIQPAKTVPIISMSLSVLLDRGFVHVKPRGVLGV